MQSFSIQVLEIGRDCWWHNHLEKSPRILTMVGWFLLNCTITLLFSICDDVNSAKELITLMLSEAQHRRKMGRLKRVKDAT